MAPHPTVHKTFARRAFVVLGIVTIFAAVYYAIPFVSSDTPHFHRFLPPNGEVAARYELDVWNSVYFSLVTQSTVGYGSIVPVSAVAKCAVSIQVLSTLLCVVYLSTRAHFV